VFEDPVVAMKEAFSLGMEALKLFYDDEDEGLDKVEVIALYVFSGPGPIHAITTRRHRLQLCYVKYFYL
jgi:hypothetical protein